MRDDAVHVISFRRANTKEVKRYVQRQGQLAAQPNNDNPEQTAQDFAVAQPALGVVAEAVHGDEAHAMQRGRGRPPTEFRTVNHTLRLDPDVLEANRTEGSGCQPRIDDVLRQHMPHRSK